MLASQSDPALVGENSGRQGDNMTEENPADDGPLGSSLDPSSGDLENFNLKSDFKDLALDDADSPELPLTKPVASDPAPEASLKER